MSKYIDLTGQKFGKLTVIERAEDYVSPKGKHVVMWYCKCDCGNTKSITRSGLLRQGTRSCGCLCKDSLAKARLKRWHKNDNSETNSQMINKEKTIVKKVVDNMNSRVDTHMDNSVSFADAYSRFEKCLNNQQNKSINIKSTMLWSALKLVSDMNIIDEDTMKKTYGEFMFKQMEQ